MLMTTEIDEKYMRMALRLAEKARGRTSPNPMVGAVVVKDGRVIATGTTNRLANLMPRPSRSEGGQGSEGRHALRYARALFAH